MARKFPKLAVLAKIETTYGVDAVPTGAANAIQAIDVTIDPFEGDEEERELMRPYFGAQGLFFTGNYAKVTFSVELTGSGTAGTAPAFGPMIRACGMAEIVTAATKVDYLPVSDNPESVSIYWNMDGVRHVLLGARGNLSIDPFTPKRIPRLKFEVWGLLGTVTDVALPTVDLTKFIDPIPVSKDNTPTFSLHGVASIGESLTLNLGNQVEPRFLIGQDSIQIVNRKSSGQIVLEAVAVATKNWIATAKAHTRGELAVVHGITAGNIVEMGCPAIQVGRPKIGQTQNIINNTLPLIPQPLAGDDELKFTFR
ncbi:MAG: hypothetical protein DI566_13520 [Microbacterium sp.]|nr:MAG: hypothetical protein DI566_13520 [Microbacterium sp.]